MERLVVILVLLYAFFLAGTTVLDVLFPGTPGPLDPFAGFTSLLIGWMSGSLGKLILLLALLGGVLVIIYRGRGIAMAIFSSAKNASSAPTTQTSSPMSSLASARSTVGSQRAKALTGHPSLDHSMRCPKCGYTSPKQSKGPSHTCPGCGHISHFHDARFS